jgi:hypothetical protein
MGEVDIYGRPSPSAKQKAIFVVCLIHFEYLTADGTGTFCARVLASWADACQVRYPARENGVAVEPRLG